MNSPDTVTENRQGSILGIALISLSGSSIEWYDFFIYGSAARLGLPNVVLSEI
jgi:hypothetical protein